MKLLKEYPVLTVVAILALFWFGLSQLMDIRLVNFLLMGLAATLSMVVYYREKDLAGWISNQGISTACAFLAFFLGIAMFVNLDSSTSAIALHLLDGKEVTFEGEAFDANGSSYDAVSTSFKPGTKKDGERLEIIKKAVIVYLLITAGITLVIAMSKKFDKR